MPDYPTYPNRTRARTHDRTATGCVVRVGDVFGRLRVVEVNRRLYRKRAADLVCECGGTKRVRYEHLLSGEVRSCGCLRTSMLRRWRVLREDDLAYQLAHPL
jgi:hypothetical protein